MVRSRLPLPSLLGLFGALLMPSPALLGNLSDTPVTDPEVQEPLAFAVERYNQDRSDSANYFKVLSLMKTLLRGPHWMYYFFKVEFVKTTCQKNACRLTFKKIQKCERLPGNQEEPVCYFLITKMFDPELEMEFENIFCSSPGLP